MPSKPRYCCICSNHGHKLVNGRKVSMHRFPSDPQRRRVWIQRCKNARRDFSFKNYDQTRICSHHFSGGNGPSSKTSLPSIFPRPDGSTKYYQTTAMTEERVLPIDSDDDGNATLMSPDSSHDEYAIGLATAMDESILDVSLKLHDYTGTIPEVTKIRHQSEQAIPDTVTVGTQTDNMYHECVNTSSQTVSTGSTNSVSIQTQMPLLTYDDISSNDSKVMFYTGIPDSGTFKCIFDELAEGMAKQSNNGRPRSLRLIDEFFMVLMRLRLGLLYEDLADRFQISVSTCGSIFNRWIDFLDSSLEFLVMWPSRNNVNVTMPKSFKKKYPKCRVVIDCTEIRTETPSSLQLKSLLYSDYKSHMTYKSLIGIKPDGVVTFVSDLYAGSISDKQITRLSGLVDLCEEGDAIMADKGFLISDLTTPKGIHLIIPPFKQSKKQLSRREVHATRNIANLRIHVERQMERIKNFRIVQGIMPITMAYQASKIWKVCVRLTNLQPPLVLRN